jgi:hypothetical protein
MRLACFFDKNLPELGLAKERDYWLCTWKCGIKGYEVSMIQSPFVSGPSFVQHGKMVTKGTALCPLTLTMLRECA